jgi:hypothetical protein
MREFHRQITFYFLDQLGKLGTELVWPGTTQLSGRAVKYTVYIHATPVGAQAGRKDLCSQHS